MTELSNPERSTGSTTAGCSRLLARRLGLEALGVAVLAFAVYAIGAARVIYVGDSGELTAAAATLGIPHPSGYPLYVLLGHVWIRALFFLTPAFAMSLFSAVAAALALAGVYAVATLSCRSRLVGAFAAALLGVSPSFWSQANVQRVYALNAAFLVIVLAAAWMWFRTRRDGWMVSAAFLTALGAANHTAMALVGVSVGVCAVLADSGWLRRFPKCIAAAAAGLTPYLYLPLRSRGQPQLDWGDPESLSSLWHVVTRRDYWHRRWIESPADLMPISWDWLLSIGQEFFLVGALLAAIGALVSQRYGWPRLLLPLVLVTNLAAMALHGSRSDLFLWHRYYIPSYVGVALLAGIGFAFVTARVGKSARFLMLLPLMMAVLGWPRFDRSDHRVADEFSRELLSSLPPGAVLSATDDSVFFPLIYLQLVEEMRPDVHLMMRGVQGNDPGMLRLDPQERPLFFTHPPSSADPQIEVVPVGPVYRIVRKGQPAEKLAFEEQLEGEFDPRLPKDFLTRQLIGHFHFMHGISHENTDWPRAQSHWSRAADVAYDNDVHFYNMGLIFRRNGLPGRSLAAFERSVQINPRRLRPDSEALASVWVERMRGESERQQRIVDAVRTDLGIEPDDDSPTARWSIAWELVERGEPLLARGQSLLALEAGGVEDSIPPREDTLEQ